MNLLLDTTGGTHVLGSRFGQLLTTFRDREGDSFDLETESTLRFADDWLLAQVDDEIARYYAAQIEKRFGIKLNWRSLWGAHVSVIRGEVPLKHAERWGEQEGQIIPIRYTHSIYTSGQHWWLNVECDEFANIRDFYGFQTRKRWFHLTIGRI
jgi:hypothetical protein